MSSATPACFETVAWNPREGDRHHHRCRAHWR